MHSILFRKVDAVIGGSGKSLRRVFSYLCSILGKATMLTRTSGEF